MIITQKPTEVTTSLDRYSRSLEIGEKYEDYAVARLRTLGLDAHRPKQRNIPKHRLRAEQIDIKVRGFADGIERNIEVKARNNNVWNWPDILVGCCRKWDDKEEDIFAIMVICQLTDDIRIAPYRKVEWVKRTINFEPSYSIPVGHFYPLDHGVSRIKSRYTLTDLRPLI